MKTGVSNSILFNSASQTGFFLGRERKLARLVSFALLLASLVLQILFFPK